MFIKKNSFKAFSIEKCNQILHFPNITASLCLESPHNSGTISGHSLSPIYRIFSQRLINKSLSTFKISTSG